MATRTNSKTTSLQAKPFTHGSLFSGIGGFDLAAEWMGWTNVFHCEWDGFCQKILQHYWPKAISYGDITKTDFTVHKGKINVLTGGFPCQPYSHAGTRKGTDDERHLWPEMLRAIQEIKPDYVVGENVYGLLNWGGGLVFEEVQDDLEDAGYEVQAVLLPAIGVGADHIRQRIWFVAHARGMGRQDVQDDLGGSQEQVGHTKRPGPETKWWKEKTDVLDPSCNTFLRYEALHGEPAVLTMDDGIPPGLDGITLPQWITGSLSGAGNAVVPQVAFEIFKAIEKTDGRARSNTQAKSNKLVTDRKKGLQGPAKKDQYQINKEIEVFIKEKDSKKEPYSNADIDYIQQYEGAGGQGSKGAKGEGVLYEFYTPDYICDLMYGLAVKHGYDQGSILEPAIATGRLIKPFPDKSKVTGFEINPVTARICELTYPGATIHKGYFETAFLKPPRYTERVRPGTVNIPTWLEDYPFSLVMGNPPYGKYKNKYSSYFKTPKMQQIELMFMYYGMKVLNPGGLLVYLTSSNFLRNGISYNKEKQEIGKLAELVDAYRLPPVFRFSQVPTDIIVLRRKI